MHIKNSLREKLIDIKFDCKLDLTNTSKIFAKKAPQKLNTLALLAPCMEATKKRILMNAFFKSQLNFSPLVWMCRKRSLNTKINRLHKRCLWISIVLRNGHVFFFVFVCSLYFINLYEAICQLLFKIWVVRWP